MRQIDVTSAPMDLTIAVGLITSGSTIAGGLIASLSTLMAQKNQARHQERLTEAEHRELRNNESIRLRREAYLTLLNKFDEITELTVECWKDRPCVDPQRIPANETELALEKSVKSLDVTLNAVMLEGPAAIIDVAHKAKRIFRDEMLAIARLSLDNAGINNSLQAIDPEEYIKRSEQRISAKYEIIRVAGAILAGVITQQNESATDHDLNRFDAASNGSHTE
jgi:hypothetical protein